MDRCGYSGRSRTCELVSRCNLPRQWGITRSLLCSGQTENFYCVVEPERAWRELTTLGQRVAERHRQGRDSAADCKAPSMLAVTPAANT